MSRTLPVLFALLLQIPWFLAAAQEQTEPLKTGLTEEVEVRFVILDALVTDSRGEIVTDLSREEFELYLDLKPHAVASVDLFCPEGAAAEPKAVERMKYDPSLWAVRRPDRADPYAGFLRGKLRALHRGQRPWSGGTPRRDPACPAPATPEA